MSESTTETSSGAAIALVYAKVLELDEQLHQRDAVIAALREDKRRWPWETTADSSGHLLRQHLESLIELEKAAARGDAGAARVVPDAMYRHVTGLEQQLAAAGKFADEQRQTIAKMERRAEEIEKALGEHERKRGEIESVESEVAVLRNKVADLGKQLMEAADENRVLVEAGKAKMRAVEEIGAKLDGANARAAEATGLRAELESRNRTIAQLTDESSRMVRAVHSKEVEIERLQKELAGAREASVSFAEWMRERSAMQEEIRKLKEAKLKHERSSQRVSLLAAAARTPGKREEVAGVIDEEDGEEDQQSPQTPAMVPARLHEILEKNSRKMQADLGKKERELIQKDQEILALQKKLASKDRAIAAASTPVAQKVRSKKPVGGTSSAGAPTS